MKNEDLELFQEFLEFKKFKEEQEKIQKKEYPKKNKVKKSKYTKRSDGRYTTTIVIGYKDDGTPIKKTLYAKTISELDSKITEYKLEVSKGTNFSKRKMTFKDYRSNWWESKLLNINAVKTKKMYEGIFKYFLSIDYMMLVDITTKDLQCIINKNKEHPRTCKLIKLTLNEIFKKAISERIIYYNPCDALITPSYKSKEKRALTDDENYLTDLDIFTDRERMFILLIKYCGLRKEEALALHKKDFDISNARLSITKAITFDRNKSFLKSTKNGNPRVIPLPINIIPFVSYYLSNLSIEILFTNISSETYITESGYRRMWQSIIKKLKKASIENNKTIGDDLTAHIFRHNYACMLMKANVDMKERQYLLGHSTIAVTMDIYTHIEENKMQAPNLLNIYLKKVPS